MRYSSTSRSSITNDGATRASANSRVFPLERYLIHEMVGDIQRLKAYPERGFQIPQHVPERVWYAYEQLVAKGYTDHQLLSDEK